MALLAVAACAAPQEAGPLVEVSEIDSHTSVRLQAISVASADVLWASGLEGTYAKSVDGGATWQSAQVPGAGALELRDVHAFDARLVYLLSSGPGEQSRIFKTSDGGATWQLQYVNGEPEGFLDCFDFWGAERGVVYGDSVDGRLVVLTTADGGATWSRMRDDALPPAGPGEGGFAASGTCVATRGADRAWIGTGAGGHARVLASADGGRSWTAAETPLVRGEAAGVMSVLFLDARTGVVLGGDLNRRDARTANVASSEDGGRTWSPGGLLRLAGPAYGGAWGGSPRRPLLVAAGPGGLDLSLDRGRTWRALSDTEYWAVAFSRPDTLWAVGPAGRITRFRITLPAKEN